MIGKQEYRRSIGKGTEIQNGLQELLMGVLTGT